MIRKASCALLVASGAAFGQALPFTETFDTDNAGWGDGPGNPAVWSPAFENITSQTVDASSDFAAPFPGAPAFATILRATPTSSGGNFAGDYLAGGIAEMSFDIGYLAPGPFGFLIRFANAANSNAFITETRIANPGGDTLTFSLEAADLAPAGPGGPIPSRLMDIQQFQILAVQLPFSPTAGAYTFSADNISIAVPAPASLAAFGLAGIGALRRRR